MRYCCVKECKNTSASGEFAFFSFPKEALTKEAWIKFVNRPNWTVKPNSKICSVHFSPHVVFGNNYLRPGAMPSPPDQHRPTEDPATAAKIKGTFKKIHLSFNFYM